MTNCQRSYFHRQWDVLLDEEFLKAYEHGITILCGDGKWRVFYPRIFTYSADYPEKYARFLLSSMMTDLYFDRIALAAVRNHALSPCPRCLIPKTELYRLGMRLDAKRRKTWARMDNSDRQSRIEGALKWIHECAGAIAGPVVEEKLKAQSLVAIEVSTNMFESHHTQLCIECFHEAGQVRLQSFHDVAARFVA